MSTSGSTNDVISTPNIVDAVDSEAVVDDNDTESERKKIDETQDPKEQPSSSSRETTNGENHSSRTNQGNGFDSSSNQIYIQPSLIDAIDDETTEASAQTANQLEGIQDSKDSQISQMTMEESTEAKVDDANGVSSSTAREEVAAEALPQTEDADVLNDAAYLPTTCSPKQLRKISTLLGCGTTESLKEFIKSTPKRLNDSSKENLESTNNHDDNAKDDALAAIEETEDDGRLDEPLEFSDLSNPVRNVWIVTTAALPWRTGTAINPFLRALYLVKRRLDNGVYDGDDDDDFESKDVHVTDEPPVNDEETSKGDENSNTESNDAPRNSKGSKWYDLKTKKNTGKVTLVIPWLEDRIQANKLYGEGTITEHGEAGKEQQIQWIQKYADEKCGMAKEMQHLHILFYSAAYWKAFGSIFPTEDICSLIPNDEADVAILEEPEHLNWFRMPNAKSSSKKSTGEEEEIRNYSGPPTMCGLRGYKENNSAEVSDNNDDTEDLNEDEESPDSTEKNEEKSHHELGWAHKFNFVVGIIHTNYSAYIKQYGLGSSIVGAPALGAMSSMVVRAYCHKVIRLSAVIPNYAKWKEVTSNVHGVRGDFLHGKNTNDEEKEVQGEEDEEEEELSSPLTDDDVKSAPIYFIGKLLWAKGFDRMLKVQELFRETNPNHEYFSIDVYGGGPDETAILRAFHGRLQGVTSKENMSDQKAEDEGITSPTSFSHATIFSHPQSLKKQLHNLVDKKEHDVTKAYSDAMSFINMGFEVVAPDMDNENTSNHDVVVMEHKVLVSDQKDNVADPLSILSDVSGNFAATGMATTEAMLSIADTAVKTGIAATFSQDEDNEIKTKPSFIFDPPKSLFELRRNPIPARFLGVKDHALLRDSPHKIFLNPSVTEVLCTTTAEALSMGKFVIIPDHPSNQFFLQFPNCLAYKNLRECVEKISWALENDPTPLSEEHAHIFTWEAATDRLIESSIVTKREGQERDRYGRDKADSRMAWLHSQGGKKGQFIKTLFVKSEATEIEKEHDKSDGMKSEKVTREENSQIL